MNEDIRAKFKPNIHPETLPQQNGILLCMGNEYLDGDNRKYMKMYDWMAAIYDVGERWLGRMLYGNAIIRLRQQLMQMLPWRDGASVLYVSIGTGADLRYLPPGIHPETLDCFGADISLGMLKKCRANWRKKVRITLVQCPAENLPFADDAFDIVFHNGGFNFFNDKPRAAAEMMRVAKSGSTILIADETGDFVDAQYKKSLFSRKYFEGASVDLSEIKAALPPDAEDKHMRLLWDGRFYAMTFGKP